ncbi:reverse transcriptase family protein [bacterium]|nr:reverse transcriptase family protein [bacterium]MDC1448382.1 reverse transcriptase family protein [bacterium]
MSPLETLSKILEIDVALIGSVASEVGKHYKRFPLKTGRARPRWIDAPSGDLKKIQRALLDYLLYDMHPHPVAHGFFPGRSIVTNARPHVGKNWVLSFDVKDFFPSTTSELVRQSLVHRGAGHDHALWGLVTDICTLKGKLPQGAPTSPHLANLCFYPCDEVLAGYAAERGLHYTRYADDMTFSGAENPDGLESVLKKTLAPFGYVIADKKTKHMGRDRRQSVTGLVVNNKVALPRTLRRTMRAIQHDAMRLGLAGAVNRSRLVDSESEFWGYLAFKKMVEQKME